MKYQTGPSVNRTAWFLVGFALPWVTFIGLWDHLPSWSARSGGVRAITTGVPMFDVLIMFTVMAVIAGKSAIGLRERLHRRAFLEQKA